MQVDNRLLVRALAEAARRAGVRLQPRTAVALELARGAPRIVRPSEAAGDDDAAYDAVLVAAGAWSGSIAGVCGVLSASRIRSGSHRSSMIGLT